jgi:hypothetical protein
MTRTDALAALALVLAGLSIFLPIVAMPAFLVVTLAIIIVGGRARLLVAGLGGTLVAVGFVRFLLVYAVPNIVIAGQIAAEDKAVSRLREIRWAENAVREMAPGTYRPLSTLVAAGGAGASPEAPLSDRLFRPADDAKTIFRIDAYDVRVYLPAAGGGWTSDPARVDAAAAGGAFVAYAWPIGARHGGERVFFIDQDEQICESSSAAFRGPNAPPPATAAFSGVVGADCGGPSAPDWHPWKNKKRASKDRS